MIDNIIRLGELLHTFDKFHQNTSLPRSGTIEVSRYVIEAEALSKLHSDLEKVTCFKLASQLLKQSIREYSLDGRHLFLIWSFDQSCNRFLFEILNEQDIYQNIVDRLEIFIDYIERR